MQTKAVIVAGPRVLELGEAELIAPEADGIVVDVAWSGISTGTERLFWSGEMPAFPGMGYPLVPGYESAGEVVEAGPASGFAPGDWVFVPGASCYRGLRGLFGGASRRIVTAGQRATRIDRSLGAEGALLALAATARHAIAGLDHRLPDLIVGHGVLGRLLARLTIAAGGRPPVVWETSPARREGARGYEVADPAADDRRDYGAIYDASGDGGLIDALIGRLAKGGEIVLAGFYTRPLTFAYPPAFMKEARLRVAAEWTAEDLIATRALIESGALSLDGLVTHVSPAGAAERAYATAFTDPACLKMILDWSAVA
ncbi:MAG: chlorophyll synthesis pathway protein BchC [Rhodobacteraceae bacterium]|nr:chlorophyll synthesis pathway protein BchC [Paracoccaceae bacterium]